MDKLVAIFCLAQLAIVGADIGKSAIVQTKDNSSLYRLPKNVLPESYDILLLTNVTRGDFSYKGEVSISLRVLEKTKRIILHSEKLQIDREKSVLRRVLTKETSQVVRISDQNYDDDTQFYTISFADEITPGKYVLKLYFIGEVLDDVLGFYRSSYRVNNETRWIGVTQFSTTFARRAFPCMDEPAFKATFQLSLGHYANETVTSNTFQDSRDITDRPNYYITRFSRTQRMSTYLLGWAIHDFRRVNSSDPRFWLWTRYQDTPSQPMSASPILVEGPKIYAALEAYTGLSNLLSKVEQFAVPDFHFSAMENWGFITYRESVPLIWDSVTPVGTINNRLITMAHEYAHTWFGNLVSPEFWSVAWLKEGFATYFAYRSLDSVHEDWRMMDLFSLETLQSSMLADSEEHNRTMNGRGVGSPKSAAAAMDFVTYKKGASIIRMIADVVGEKLFRDSMRSYLKEKQYEAATPSDLYKNLESVLNSSVLPLSIPVPIGEFIESWANQPNYPLVRVSRVDHRKLRLSQEPFYLNSSKATKTDRRFWWIPVKILSSSEKGVSQLAETSTWLGSNESYLVELSSNASENGWYVLNPRQIGYYRVDYEAKTWEALRALLDSDDFRTIPALNRAALVDDVFMLARAGYEKYGLALGLARYLIREDEYEPWVAATRAIRLINKKLRDKADAREAFRRYASELITPVYEKLGFDDQPSDSRIRKMQRNLILATACTLNLEHCVSRAKSIFDDWIADENKPVPVNLRSFVYKVGVTNGTDNDWIELWRRFSKTISHSERELMFSALGGTENPSFINKYFGFAIHSNSDIAEQYRLSIIQSIIAGSSKNIATALNYVETNLNKIIELRSVPFLEGILSTIGKEITSIDQKNTLSKFIVKNTKHLESAKETVEKAIKSAENNIAWIDMCASQIVYYLNKK